MSKNTKTWLIAAVSLIIIGNLIFCGAMSIMGWNFSKLSTVRFDDNEYEFNEEVQDIKINTNLANIQFLPSSNSKTKVILHEQRNLHHSTKLENQTLTINVEDTRKWYDYINNITFETPNITVYLPENLYGNLSINTATGSIEIPENFKFESINLATKTGSIKNYASADSNITLKTDTGAILVEKVMANTIESSTLTGKVNIANVTCQSEIKISISTGKTNLTNIKSKNIISNGNTGSILLENVIASEKISIERQTGNVKFKDSDAKEIYVNTTTGSIKGNLLTDKTFFTQSKTGSVDVPKTISEERCEINTITGSIKITVGHHEDNN